MAYQRYKSSVSLTKAKKVTLMSEYISHYSKLIQEHGNEVMNVKIPREVFTDFLDNIGSTMNEYVEKMVNENDTIKEFLEANPLPPHMSDLLSNEFRVFSLMLNALKQWVSAESAYTDRYLLGGTARQTCKEATDKCIVTGDELGEKPELHHPIRDGRPPILISKAGHDLLEYNSNNDMDSNDNELLQIMKRLKKEKHMSWVLIREGCTAKITGSTNYRQNAMSYANSIINATGLSAEEVINFLKKHNL